MMKPILRWVEEVNTDHELHPSHILDIGSYDNKYGNEMRHLFGCAEYIGIDIRRGMNVDAVMDAYKIDKHFPPNSFDAVLCFNVLEHLQEPWLVIDKIKNVLQKDGFLYVSIPTIGFPVHNYPGDYWRPTEQAVQEVIMRGFKIISLRQDVSEFHKYPFINCLGVKHGS